MTPKKITCLAQNTICEITSKTRQPKEESRIFNMRIREILRQITDSKTIFCYNRRQIQRRIEFTYRAQDKYLMIWGSGIQPKMV